MAEKEEITNGENPSDALRDDIESAIADVEAVFEEGPNPTSKAAVPDSGEGEAKPAEAKAGEAEDKPGADGGDDAKPSLYPEDEAKYPTLNDERVVAAPEGWRPAAREGWKDLSPEIRREIHRRELDIAAGMDDASDARQTASQFKDIVEPYRAIMAAEGTPEPMAAVAGLLQTAANLRMGSPQNKAERIAGLIGHYGVDIALLDDILAKGPSGGAPAASDPVAAMVEEKMRPVNEFMIGLQGQMKEVSDKRDQSTAKEVADFTAEAEFIAETRMDVADLLDMAAARGKTLSMKAAYDIACQANPEIKAILDKRVNGERTSKENDRIAEKEKLASSSLTGGQVGTGGGGQKANGSMRDDIEASIAALEER